MLRLNCNLPGYVEDEVDDEIPDHLSIINNIDDKVSISPEARWKYMKLADRSEKSDKLLNMIRRALPAYQEAK